MQGVAKYDPDAVGGLQSLLAGNDMLCLPGDVPGTIEATIKALKKKQLDKKDLEARVKRVLLAKYHLGLNKLQPINIDGLTKELNMAVPSLRAEAAEHALTIVQLTHPRLLPLQQNDRIAYVGIGLTEANTFATLLKDHFNADLYFFDYKADDSTKAEAILNALQNKYSKVIVGVHKLAKSPANNFGFSDAAIQLAQNIQQINPTITMVFANPYAIKNVSTAPNIIACYEDDAIFQQKAFDWLNGKFAARGTLPVTVGNFKYGNGVVNAPMELAFAAPEEQGLSSQVLNKADSIAEAAIAQQATPGCVLLVARNGKIVFNRAYGYYSYDRKQPVTTETVYDLASVTKISATTVAVMKLYDEGKLDIKKTLGDYLPWVKGSNKENLTLENVLLHQAGLLPRNNRHAHRHTQTRLLPISARCGLQRSRCRQHVYAQGLSRYDQCTHLSQPGWHNRKIHLQ